MAQVHRRAGTGNGGEVLDVYEYAYIAGGEQRVLESAIIALVERGTPSLRAGRSAPSTRSSPRIRSNAR